MASIPGYDHYRPAYDPNPGSPPAPRDVQKAMYEFQGSRRDGRTHLPRRGEFTFKTPRPRIADRPLLSTSRPLSPDQSFRTAQAGDKFRQPDCLTDSEEEDMVVSQSDGDLSHPPTKRPRTGPVWSNPDPYTALPPLAESPRKKQDVVRMIRKSRLAPSAAESNSPPAANGDDFISLDMHDAHAPPQNAPTAPRHQHPVAGAPLGKRKRDLADDVGKVPPRATKGSRLHKKGKVLPDWRSEQEIWSTPWYGPPSTPDLLPGIALHEEILDFYEWVRPQPFEQEIRMDVVTRLQKTFSRLEPACRLEPFGSFAAGLYLPIGDMDLVLMTNGRGASKPYRSAKNLLWTIHDMLRREEMAVPGSLHPITKAKVPIIKFVDAVTGLKVDLSFNNDSGVTANKTFHQWKEKHPAMPILVSIIKQYLMMRGLNDVAFGGLGGFSTICLVTSLIQHHVPSAPIPNLGELLLQFFHLYGRVFNKQDISIRLEPPGYVRKELYLPFRYSSDKPNRLSIIDPNKADNNLSGGTAEIDLIFQCFSQSSADLEARMTARERSPTSSKSLLVGLIGGDYDAYSVQRERLRAIHSGRSRGKGLDRSHVGRSHPA